MLKRTLIVALSLGAITQFTQANAPEFITEPVMIVSEDGIETVTPLTRDQNLISKVKNFFASLVFKSTKAERYTAADLSALEEAFPEPLPAMTDVRSVQVSVPSAMQMASEKATEVAQWGSQKAQELYTAARSVDTAALYNNAVEQGKNLYASARNVTLDDVKAVAAQGSTKACELYKQALVKGKDVYTSARNLTLADVQNFAQTSKDSLVVAVRQTPAKTAELYKAAQQLTLANAMNFAQENRTSLALATGVVLGGIYAYNKMYTKAPKVITNRVADINQVDN